MKTILTIVVGLAVAGLVAWHYCGDSSAARPTFSTLPVMRGDLLIGVTATGTVEPQEIIDVGAQIMASVKEFGPDLDTPGKTIDYCSRVTKGTVLARLDDLSHQAELDRTTANVQFAQADVNHCLARQKQTERAFRRAKELRTTDSEAAYEKAEAEDEMARAELAMTEAKLEQAKIAKKQAEINLAYTVIRSPIDGTVIDRRVNIGQTVVAGASAAPCLFLLAKDLRRMLVWAAVNEADIGEIQMGQSVKFSVDAYRDRTFTGKVSQVRLNASLQQNVVTYGVMVEVDNADGKLLPYMTAKLQFQVVRRQDALLVPSQALRWQPTRSQVSPWVPLDEMLAKAGEGRAKGLDEETESTVEPKVDFGTPTVWRVGADGLVRPVSVKTGLSDGMVTEILEGELVPGDAVVTSVRQKAEPDFVSSFVSKVTDSKN